MDSPEQFLERFHDAAPGGTPETFEWMRDERGHSSYDWLAAVVEERDAVLDLCCGDGVLLAKVRARGAGPLLGVDLSQGELTAATRRLGSAARLFRARAQDLPLSDDRADVVLCHMALMLLDDVDAVMAEIQRVLRPGGRLAVVVGTGPAEGAWAVLVKHLRAMPWRLPKLGDPRTRRAEDLRALLSARFIDVQVDLRTVHASAPFDSMWQHFLRTYNAPTLFPEELADLRERVARELGEGDVSWGTPMLFARAGAR